MSSARTRAGKRHQLTAAPNVWPILLGAGVLFLLAAHERLIWPQILGCVLVAMVVTSFVAVARPVSFDIDVEAPERVVVGEPFEVALRLDQPRGRSSRSIVVRWKWRSRRAIIPPVAAFVEDTSDTTVVRARATALVRGAAAAVDVRIEMAAPFGFFSRTMFYSVPRRLLVLPARGQQLRVLTGTGRQQGVVPGYLPDVDVRGVRDWRPGDRINQVHWRSVVRTGRMTVVERDGGSAGHVVVLVVAPAERGRPVKDPIFESALTIAASTTVAALHRGVPICVVANAKGLGIRHPDDEAALLECFARIDIAKPPSDALLDHVLAHAAHGGAVLLASAKTTPKSVRAGIFEAAVAVGAVMIDLSDVATAPSTTAATTQVPA